MHECNKALGRGFAGCAGIGLAALGLLAALPAAAQQNATQQNMAVVVNNDCGGGTPDAAGAAWVAASTAGGACAGQLWDTAPLAPAVSEIAPEQLASQGAQSARTTGGRAAGAATITSRLGLLRAGSTARFQIELDGQEVYANALSELGPEGLTRGAAGDDSGAPGRLGAFLNGSYQFGDVDSTFQAVGFDYDNGGITAGVDYRVLEDLILGGAFTWWHTKANFRDNAGSTTSDLYSGTIFGTYYPFEGLYVNALASGGGARFDTQRRITYTQPNAVNATADGSPKASDWSVNGGLGYDFSTGALSLGPYFQTTFRQLDVDPYSESGGGGWAANFDRQKVKSLTTTLGGQISYALSTPVGVITPQVRAAWWHQFRDNSRAIGSTFVGAANQTTFFVFTENPDRDYGTLGASVAMTLPRGFAAFFDYDVVLGYRDLTSNRFTFGVRAAFF